ncbi:MAG: formylmethanofuran dehydrogenase subunit E family protein [Candidatus Omnitrophota bacterium]
MISLKAAAEFHGHLGPWLVLGLRLGEYGVKAIRAKRYFGVETEVFGLCSRPRSCLIDGLQLSTGCTLGKGNIKVRPRGKIRIRLVNCRNNKVLTLFLKQGILDILDKTRESRECQKLAKRLYKMSIEEMVL